MEHKIKQDSIDSPSSTTKEAVDYNLQFPTWSMEYLKKTSIELKLVRPRSLAWAVMLNAIPSPDGGDIMLSIKGHRNLYNDLKEKLSMDPREVIGDDPLSQNDESAWKQHFCDNELKALILQDVVRTFPDEVFFRDKDIQDMMVRVLFFWARAHPSPGYRQGMHEILAPLLYELHNDRKFAPNDLSDTLRYYLDDRFLENDSYMLFNAVMKGLEQFYTTGDVIPTSCGRLPTVRSLHNQNEAVRYLERVREDYLVPADPELAAHLSNCNISMELFGIRWLRLLFGREFPRTEIPQLWGFIFSDGPMLPNVHYIIVAMLIAIRSTLLSCDTGSALSVLMRPMCVCAAHVCALALHLRHPRHPRPPTPGPLLVPATLVTPPQDAPPISAQHKTKTMTISLSKTKTMTISLSRCEEAGSVWFEQRGRESDSEGSEGVAEGGDVARSLAALALVRARLPPALAALRAALPRPPPAALPALHQLAQLAALLQCRNHALIDVETALEAAENQTNDAVGKKQLVPVVMLAGKSKAKVNQNQVKLKLHQKAKEVPLKVFHQVECDSTSDLPFLDPLRIRTE
ncbi:TBC1 domain family member 5 homolog A [Zerene cesonia]|uniref:TBC1 domain family member 5 homolog A n=1 Tax=Zerene cesonia TaxID=33412 RepID=UPI0018E546B4|nr:TBC1 domain family member 5 homolog A [Zerene cesonia]